MTRDLLDELVADILRSDHHFLDGLHRTSSSFAELAAAVIDWSRRIGRPLDSLSAGIEPAFRQSVLFSLIPQKALDRSYEGSYDAAIDEHVRNLGMTLSEESKSALRNLIINVVRLRGMSADVARFQTAKLRDLRANPGLYQRVLDRQGGRCVWCGIDLNEASVKQSLEHMLPKHLGDDPPEAHNWAVACSSCNSGKRDAVAWATSPWAYDYFERTDFEVLGGISLQHRWTVLCRDRRCFWCELRSDQTELFNFKRIETGLPVPSNCGTTCSDCAIANGLTILEAEWVPGEIERARR